MANSAPGFKKHPEHEITLRRGAHVVVRHGGHVVAETTSAVLLDESRYPSRAYVPRADITATLTPTAKTTHCPFKGDTVYFDVDVEGERLAESAWSYESPFDEMAAISGLVAFDDAFEVTTE